MKSQKGATLFELFVVLLWALMTWGWIWNIVKIVDTIDAPITAFLILRAVGIIVAPLGAVLGFF